MITSNIWKINESLNIILEQLRNSTLDNKTRRMILSLLYSMKSEIDQVEKLVSNEKIGL